MRIYVRNGQNQREKSGVLPTEGDWNDWGIHTGLEKLFYLRWLELFSADSADTWQVRTLNLKKCVVELQDIIRRSRTHPKYRHNVPEVLKEAQSLAKSDPVCGAKCPAVRELLERASGQTDADLRRLEATMRTLFTMLDNYERWLAEELQTLLASNDDKEKSRLVALEECLASALRGRGYSNTFLYSLAEVLRQRGETFPQRLSRVLVRCEGRELNYHCYFHISAPVVCNSDDPIVGFRGEDLPRPVKSRLQGGTENFARVTVRAVDPVAATSLARDLLTGVLAAQTFYLPENAHFIRRENVLVDWEGGQESVPLTSVQRYLKNAKNPVQKVERLRRVTSRFDPAEQRRIGAALEHNRLAMRAPSDEARLVNLWIALESLVQHGSDSLIGDVCEHVPPVMTLAYPYQLLTSLAIQLRFDRSAFSSTFVSSELMGSRGKRVDPQRLLINITKAEGHADARQLYDAVAHNPLLRHRIFTLRKAFSEPSRLAKLLRAHQTNIDWQLRRIYRARNQVVHQATRPLHLGQLIQHLHTYFSTVVRTLVHADDRLDSVFHVLENRRQVCALILHRLDSKGARVGRRGLLDGRIDIEGDTGLWPPG